MVAHSPTTAPRLEALWSGSALTGGPLPVLSTTAGRFVTWIDTDPGNSDHVIVTYSGWNGSVSGKPGHVFRSLDGGATWTDISGALPDEPFNTLAVNPNAGETGEVYAASDTGVYVNSSAWSGNSWLRINSGALPNVSVNMLQFTNATTPKRLRAATHGRGIWEMEKGTGAIIKVDKGTYDCGEVMTVEVQDTNRGAGSVTVTMASRGEWQDSVTLPEFPAASGHFIARVPLTGSPAIAGDGKLTVWNADVITVRYRRKVPGPASTNTYEATAITNCDRCAGSNAAGSNVRIEPSVSTAIEGGDGDAFLDNGETGLVDFSVRNIGAGSLTNVRITRVASSNPAVLSGTMPLLLASSLAQCTTLPATYRFGARVWCRTRRSR